MNALDMNLTKAWGLATEDEARDSHGRWTAGTPDNWKTQNLTPTQKVYVKKAATMIAARGYLEPGEPFWWNSGAGGGTLGQYHRGSEYINKQSPTGTTRFNPGANLSSRMSDKEETVVHEYGHHIDWVWSGRQYNRPSDEWKSWWSTEAFKPWFPTMTDFNKREVFAEAFSRYIYTGTTKGIYFPSLGPERNSQLTSFLDSEFKSRAFAHRY